MERQSWGSSNDGGLRMVNCELQFKTPPQSPEDVYCILLIRIEFCNGRAPLQGPGGVEGRRGGGA